MHLKNALFTVAIAAALTAPAFAQAPGNFVGGRVTAVNAAAKTVTVQGFNQQTQTFKVNATTDYQANVQGQMSDLKVGDKVRIMGQQSEDDDNTIDARAIMLNPPAGGFGFGRRGPRPGGGGNANAGARPGGGRGGPGGGRRGGVSGTIATLDPKFTVTTSDNTTKTIDTTDDTRVMESKSATFGDIAVGKMVFAQTDNGYATHVHIMPPFGGGGGWRRGGGGGGGGGNRSGGND